MVHPGLERHSERRISLAGHELGLWQALFYLLVLFYGIAILLTFSEYGITHDEPVHAKYGEDNVRWYRSLFQDREIFHFAKAWLYGGFFNTITHLVGYLSPLDTYDTRHLCNAVEYYTQALHLRPDYPIALHNLGHVLYVQGRVDEAIQTFRKLLHYDPGDTLAIQKLGDILYEQGIHYRKDGDLEAAVSAFQKVLELKPEDSEILNSLAVVYVKQADFEAACRILRRLVDRSPGRVDFRMNFSVALLNSGALEDALHQCRQALQIDPNHARAYALMGQILQGTGKLPQARDAYREALKRDPGDRTARRLLRALEDQDPDVK